jgi:putative membrane protein
MNVSKSLLFLALAGASSAAAVAADTKSVPEPATFVKKAAQDGMTEVEVGKVALAKSSDPSVRSFAQRMVTDHGKANAELSTIAEAKGIDVPKELDAEHQRMVDALAAKSGSEFDRQYSQHMNMDHRKAIELFENASRSSDADLARFAKKTLPTLRQHKQLAEKLPGKPTSAPSAGGEADRPGAAS